MASKKIYLQWNHDSLIWDQNDYTWSEVFIVIQIADAISGGGGIVINPNKPWESFVDEIKDKKIPEEVQRNFLIVVARVNGLLTSDKKVIDNVEKAIKVKHIRKTFDAFGQKVEVKVKNIKKI